MKKSPLTTFLLAALFLSATFSAIFCLLYISNTLKLRSLQGQVNLINRRNAVMSALIKEALDFSTNNPSIDPILERALLKAPKSAAAHTNKPLAK